MSALFRFYKKLMEKFIELPFREKLSYILCCLSFVLGSVLVFFAVCIEPRGEIHTSVITTFGMFLAFCGSVLGISMHFYSELYKFKSEINKRLNDVGTN